MKINTTIIQTNLDSGKVFGMQYKTTHMRIYSLFITAGFLLLVITGCSKKNHPTKAVTETAKPAEPAVVKKRPVVTATPKVITVNDKVAKRHIDGRYYYDLNGHRYWRNNKDGKYYLFNKSMFEDPAFKSPGN